MESWNIPISLRVPAKTPPPGMHEQKMRQLQSLKVNQVKIKVERNFRVAAAQRSPAPI